MEIYPLVHFCYEMPSSYTTSAQSAWHGMIRDRMSEPKGIRNPFSDSVFVHPTATEPAQHKEGAV